MCGASIAARMSFVDVLPVEPVTPTTAAAQLAPPRARERAAAPRSGSSAAITGAVRAGLDELPRARGPDEHAPRARVERGLRRSARRRRSPVQADEQVARADLARVDDRAPRARARPGSPAQPARRPPPRRTAGRAVRSSQAPPARRSTSSKGSLRPSSNSWPCSWPLPAITTTSPGAAAATASAIARAAVGLALDVRARCPRRISSMIASRVLGARVVGGDDRRGRRARTAASPISGRLRAVAVAAGAEHDVHAAVGQLARGAQHVLERVGRVRVVDEHGERLALVDRLEAAGHAVAPRPAPRAAASRSTPSARAAAIARERVLDVEAARAGASDLDRPVGRLAREREPAGSKSHVARAVVARPTSIAVA